MRVFSPRVRISLSGSIFTDCFGLPTDAHRNHLPIPILHDFGCVFVTIIYLENGNKKNESKIKYLRIDVKTKTKKSASHAKRLTDDR